MYALYHVKMRFLQQIGPTESENINTILVYCNTILHLQHKDTHTSSKESKCLSSIRMELSRILKF